MDGFKKHLGVFLTEEQGECFMQHIKADKTKGINLLMFKKFLNLDTLFENEKKFFISEHNFIQTMMEVDKQVE